MLTPVATLTTLSLQEPGGASSRAIAGIVGGILGGFLIVCIALAVLFVRRYRRRVSASTGQTSASGAGVGVILDQSRIEREKAANVERDGRLSIWDNVSGDI